MTDETTGTDTYGARDIYADQVEDSAKLITPSVHTETAELLLEQAGWTLERYTEADVARIRARHRRLGNPPAAGEVSGYRAPDGAHYWSLQEALELQLIAQAYTADEAADAAAARRGRDLADAGETR